MSKNLIRYNAIMNLILSLSQYIFPMIAFSYASRIIGAEGIGKVSFAISFASYFSMFAALGIPTYGIRACAEVGNDYEKLKKVTMELMTINFATSIFSILVYLLFVFSIDKLRENSLFLAIAGINILSNGLQAQWFFQGIEKYGYITKRTLFFRTLSLAVIVLFVRKSSDALFYCIGLILVELGSFLANNIYIIRFLGFTHTCYQDIKRHFIPILYFFASAAAISIYTNLDVVMLGFLSTDTNVGLYSAANKIYRVFNSIIAAVFTVFVPRIIALRSSNEKDEADSMIRKGFYLVELMALPISCYLIIMSGYVIDIVVGSNFRSSSTALSAFGLCNIFVGFSGVIINLIMIPLKHEKFSMFAIFFGAIENIVLNVFFITRLGMMGAVIATVVTELSVLAFVIIFERDILSKDIPRYFFFRECFLFLLIAFVTYILHIIVGEKGILFLILSSVLWGFSILIIMILARNEVMDSFVITLIKKIQRK